MHFRQGLKALKWVQLPQQCQCKLLSLFHTQPFRHTSWNISSVFPCHLRINGVLNGFSYKVNRCLARYSPRTTTTSQPSNRAPNEPAMNKNARFGHFWAKNPFFTGEIKSFVTHITENPPRHLVHSGFRSSIGQNVQKILIFMGVRKSFGTNIAIFCTFCPMPNQKPM